MSRLRYEVQGDDFPGHRADALFGKILFQVKRNLRDVRQLRASLMDLGRWVSDDDERQAMVILDEPLITEERLADEWKGMKAIFKPALFRRLKIVVYQENDFTILGNIHVDEDLGIESIIEHFRKKSLQKQKRPSDSLSDILRVLLIHWVRKQGPLTSKRLGEVTGFSYPTIAAALKELDKNLKRHSDRSVELRSFPDDEWLRLLGRAAKVRSSRFYTDHSGKPRSLEVLRERLFELKREDIAIGGVNGARRYVPGLDLVGSSRLDLTIDRGKSNGGDDFLRRLDPALVPAKQGEPARVVIHSIDRPVSFFEEGEGGEKIADEIECLLDLHEAKLEQQAAEFLQRISPISHS